MDIPVVTGLIPGSYSVIDSVFGFDSVRAEGVFNSAIDMTQAFDGVKEHLREACESMGGDAVIMCQFGYRVAVDDTGFFGAKQVLEIFAYGTAIRRG